MNKYRVEKHLLEKLKSAYEKFDYTLIKKDISKNVTFDSIWVLDEITSKSEYSVYMEKKLNTMKKHGTKNELKIMFERNSGRPHLVILNPKTPEGSNGCFTIEEDDNKITAIHLTPAQFFEPLEDRIPFFVWIWSKIKSVFYNSYIFKYLKSFEKLF